MGYRQPKPIKEVTFEEYEEMLCVLPPIKMNHGAFLVGEPYDHDGEENTPRYAMYIEYNNKYYYLGVYNIACFDGIVKEKDLYCRISGL